MPFHEIGETFHLVQFVIGSPVSKFTLINHLFLMCASLFMPPNTIDSCKYCSVMVVRN